MPSNPRDSPGPVSNATSSGDSRPTSGARPLTSKSQALSRGPSSMSQTSHNYSNAPRNAGSRTPGSRSRRGKGRASRPKEPARNFEEADIPLSEVALIHRSEPRDGQALWGNARKMKAGIRIMAGKAKVADLIDSLRGKLADVKGMLTDLDDQKERKQFVGEVPDNLPEFNVEDSSFAGGGSGGGVLRKSEALYAGERFKFCYNPIDEHERYLPGIGVRAIKSYRGSLCELLGDPANREERAAWQRKLRIESAMEANGTNITHRGHHSAHTTDSLERTRSTSDHRPSPRLREPLSAREARSSRSRGGAPVLAFPGVSNARSFDREVKRLHQIRAIAAASGS